VVLQTDGQIRTGRDIAIATMLGAEEWGIATAALVVEGCILMRKCHLNTCPVGIATQDQELRKNYTGKVEHIVNYFDFMAEHFREIMAQLGVRTVNELVGRTDFLEIDNGSRHWKTSNLDLSPILFQQENKYGNTMFKSIDQDHGLVNVLDQRLIRKTDLARDQKKTFHSVIAIKNTDRSVGTMLSHEVAKKFGHEGMTEDSIQFRFRGSAGQSFCAFGIKGLYFKLEGEANDYFGKGLSGAKISVAPDRNSIIPPDQNIIIGNVALYGATSGQAFINGMAGDRFAVRNSGAEAVVEGIGDNGCEYMTGGTVIILGDIGQNFAAGMSGGIAYIYAPGKKLPPNFNNEMVAVDEPVSEDVKIIRTLLRKHTNHTGSPLGFRLLNNWIKEKRNFLKIIPHEFKKAMLRDKVVRRRQQLVK
jgi:glutamate synthase (NADPH/NADH) large chain